ncbi:MAG: glutaminyl-peptide cyclotransferase [Flavisolibacter sp.]
MKRFHWLALPVLSIFLIECNNSDQSYSSTSNSSEPSVPSISYNVVNSLPHDTAAFTEGLEFYHNTLIESAGLYAKSRLIQQDPASGKIIKQIKLDPKYFGEGISILHDTLYQLTYKENVVLVYDARTFNKIKELPYNSGEGWGMTNDGKNLIVSNGSSNLYFFEPGSFKLLRVQNITENGDNVPNINELEFVNGFIYANQWQYNYILKIDPSSGQVVGKMDLTDLINRTPGTNSDNVLNGIAYNHDTKKFYVTGKNWPKMYEIQFAY